MCLMEDLDWVHALVHWTYYDCDTYSILVTYLHLNDWSIGPDPYP